MIDRLLHWLRRVPAPFRTEDSEGTVAYSSSPFPGLVEIVVAPEEGRRVLPVLAAAEDEPGRRLYGVLARQAGHSGLGLADSWHLHVDLAMAERFRAATVTTRSPGYAPPPAVPMPAILADALREDGFELRVKPAQLQAALVTAIEARGVAVVVERGNGTWTATCHISALEPLRISGETAEVALGKTWVALCHILDSDKRW